MEQHSVTDDFLGVNESVVYVRVDFVLVLHLFEKGRGNPVGVPQNLPQALYK